MMGALEQLSILACQVEVPWTLSAAERDQNLSQLARRVSDKLAHNRADLVLLPELCSIDYSHEAFRCLDDLSEPLDGPSFQSWQRVSLEFGCHVAFSFARKDEGGRYRITVAVAGPDGKLVGYYDKIYLAQFGVSMEKDYFSSGEELFWFDINGFRLAPIICADIRFPELCRILTVDHDVDVILHPSAYSRDPSFYSWHSFAQTRALENQVYFVSLNRAGVNYGRSIFLPPWVDELHSPTVFHETDEQLTRVIIDRTELVQARRHYPFLKDRKAHYARTIKTLGH